MSTYTVTPDAPRVGFVVADDCCRTCTQRTPCVCGQCAPCQLCSRGQRCVVCERMTCPACQVLLCRECGAVKLTSGHCRSCERRTDTDVCCTMPTAVEDDYGDADERDEGCWIDQRRHIREINRSVWDGTINNDCGF